MKFYWFLNSNSQKFIIGSFSYKVHFRPQISSNVGELHYCLGIAFWREYCKTFITQSKYAMEILDRFQMSECKYVSTPLDQNVKLYTSDGSKEVDGTLYRQLVGSLNYLTSG